MEARNCRGSLGALAVAYEPKQGQIERIVAVYSCKTSAAERFQQDLFWVQRFRERRIRFCFVTLDESFIQYATAESGEALSDKKGISLATALYDRIYLLTSEPILHEQRVFRSVDEMGNDIEQWYNEL